MFRPQHAASEAADTASKRLRPSRNGVGRAGWRAHLRRGARAGLAIGTAAISIAGCAVTPPIAPDERPRSFAIEHPVTTTLGRIHLRHAENRPKASGFRLITTGRDAFNVLLALSRIAEKSLDLQYYIWRADRTGHLMLGAVLDAAKRGVRVRLLLDDMDLEWGDGALERLSFHPNIEVRLFNPFAAREFGMADILFDFGRITHRMHNKAFIADNSVAIVGGRNVGDQYFSVNEAANYRDLDLLAAGPIVRDVSASFDEFWNSAWSVPIGAISEANGARAGVATLRSIVGRGSVASADDLYAERGSRRSPVATLEDTYARLVWTDEAVLLVDRANKPATEEPTLVQEMRAALSGAIRKEALLEIAYLIPGDSGVDLLCSAVEAGIRIRVLTNSFASNDVLSAYGAYRKFREPLVRCGVELYEMRADPDFVRTEWRWLSPSSDAYLHTKAAVLDDEHVLVGSFNMDPRSVSLNTEIALLVRNRQLAKEATEFIENGMSPDNAWRLAMEGEDIVWVEDSGGVTKRLDSEPGGDLWRSLVSSVISLLPIEDHL